MKIERLSEKLWRNIALARAKNKCEYCHQEHHLLNVHHILDKKKYRETRWDIDNAIVLCPKHHKFGRESAHSADFVGRREFEDWMIKHIGEKRYTKLRRISRRRRETLSPQKRLDNRKKILVNDEFKEKELKKLKKLAKMYKVSIK